VVAWAEMTVETYQFALKTNAGQERKLVRWAGCRRWVYNDLLQTVLVPIAQARSAEKEQTGKATTRYPSVYELQKRLPLLKKQHGWLAQPPSHALQQAVVDLSAALLKVKDGAGFPRLKRKGRCTESFRENDPTLFSVDQQNSRIKIPKLGWVRYHNSRAFQGTPKTLTVLRKGKRWFASITVELPEPVSPPTHPHSAVGIDRGVTVFAALSDGTHIEPVSPLKAAARELRVARRALARKKRGSNNRRKAAARVQHIHRKVADIRKDFLHKTSTAIAQNHDIVVLEKLEVHHMTASAKGTPEQPGKNVRAKAGLNRSILDQGWFTFEQMLDYKLKKRGGQLLRVPAAYTSQRCSACGHTAAENRPTQAAFRCLACGHTDNADTNAAKNVYRAGQALLGAPSGEHQLQQRRAQKPTRRRA
jgi:putative transposase